MLAWRTNYQEIYVIGYLFRNFNIYYACYKYKIVENRAIQKLDSNKDRYISMKNEDINSL